jgi:hypothetical protein
LAVAANYPEPPTGEELARAVFEQFRVQAQAVGVLQEERLWEALPGFVLRNARRIEGMGYTAEVDGDVIGRLWKEDGRVALLPAEVRKLADEIGLRDATTALSGLAKDGRLRRDSEEKFQVSVRIAGKKVRAYVFERLLPNMPDEDAVPPTKWDTGAEAAEPAGS